MRSDIGSKLFLVHTASRIAKEGASIIGDNPIDAEECLLRAHSWLERAIVELSEESISLDKGGTNASADNAAAYLLVFLAKRRADGS